MCDAFDGRAEMEEVKRGLVYYDVPPAKAEGEAEA